MFKDKKKRRQRRGSREVELLARLSHVGLNHLICLGLWLIQTQPHIIEYRHSQGWEIGKPIEIFMSVADGSLGDHLERVRQNHTKMTKEQIAAVSRYIISALHYLHGRNIIYRDIKPGNILYKDLYTNPTFGLADFGFSKVIDSNTTFVGTPLYLAPEVCSGAPQDFRLDIWSFGVVIYEMLAGLALDKLPWLTNRMCMSGEWCKILEKACRNVGDLAKIVTLNVERRITIDSCYASDTFPVLPNTLSYPVAETPASTPLAPKRVLKTKQRVQKNANILATHAKFHVEKVQQTPRRLPDLCPDKS
jgi:serine/threonine protein kinase